ncbi:MAG: DISARM system phospholipase D-like protein DrmC [Anaerolineae bacterium]|nr:DISARM system phospholipase D-like protein DrmC [Anaerolineae bacterium]
MKSSKLNEMAIKFVEDIPGEYILRVVDILKKEPFFDKNRLQHRLKSVIPQADVQEKIRIFIENWDALDESPSPKEMSIALSVIDAALDYQRNKESVELTWTGPKTRNVNIRRTDQALVELIDSAQKQILIVSFAVYKAKLILSALERAADRGVEIKVVVESPDVSEGKIAHDTIANLGKTLNKSARIFIWPYSKREITPNGKYGSLHAKVAVGDDDTLYISSANLTEYAMNLNMEMGLLVSGGDLPGLVEKHFEELILNGTLNEVSL